MVMARTLLISICFLLSLVAIAEKPLNTHSNYFIENSGQRTLPEYVQYYSNTNGHGIYLSSSGVSYVTESKDGSTQRIDLRFLGSSELKSVVPNGRANGSSQFYEADKQGPIEANHYPSVRYDNLYKNIDLIYYFQSDGGSKYEFVVHEGGDYREIKIAYSGLEKPLKLDEAGNLNLPCITGEIKEMAPVTFYENGAPLKSSYQVSGNTIGFRLGLHDPGRTIIIDPEIVWSTYHGSRDDDEAMAMDYDSSFNIYVIGQTSSPTFPTTPGAHQKTKSGKIDLYISKFDSVGALTWCTYFGGSGGDLASDISVTPGGDMYILGTTNSVGMQHGLNPFQPKSAGGRDVIIAKFNSRGRLKWSTYFGGSSVDIGEGIVTNDQGDLFVAGHTKSTNFKTTVNAYQKSLSDSVDGFVSKFDSSGQLIWSTLLGGKGIDKLRAICLGDTSGIYVSGSTTSHDFPIEKNRFQNTLGGRTDACIAKLDSSGNIQWTSYFGGSEDDVSTALVADDINNIYLTGYTGSSDLYISGKDTLQDTLAGGQSDVFILKMDNQGHHRWSTFYGGTNEDVATSIDWYHTAILITGYTKSHDLKMYHQANKKPLQEKKKLGYDGFHANLNIYSGKLFVSSYMGGNGDDFLNDGKFYFGGQVMVGSSKSTDFRVSIVSEQQINGGATDAVITTLCPDVFKDITYPFCTETGEAKMILADNLKAPYPITYQWQVRTLFDWKDIPDEHKFYLPPTTVKQRTYYRRVYKAGMCRDTSLYTTIYYGPIPQVDFSFDNNQCAPDTVRFKNETTISSGGFTQKWTLGKTEYTSLDANHWYSKHGNYPARLTVTGDSGCVRVDFGVVNMRQVPSANFQTLAQCHKDSVTFMNTSLTDSYLKTKWDMGDGNEQTLDSFRHVYEKKGQYKVKMHVKSLYGCEDSILKTLQIDSIVLADFRAENSCPNTAIAFKDISKRGVDSLLYNWDFGDGNTSQEQNPKYAYSKTGHYAVQLSIRTSTGCYDTIEYPITIVETPEAKADFTTYCDHDTTLFEALWTNPDTIYHYEWDLGDNQTIVDQTTLKYLYKKYGRYTVTLKTSVGKKACARTVQLNVLHDSLIKADFSVDDICEVKKAYFRNKSKLSSGRIAWRWDFDNGNYTTTRTPPALSFKPGTYNVKLSVSSGLGCSDTIVKPFIVHPNPIAEFEADTVCFGDPVSFISHSMVKGDSLSSYFWGFGDDGRSNLENPTHVYKVGNVQFKITLRVETSNGCAHTTSKWLRQYDKIAVEVQEMDSTSCYDAGDGSVTVIASGGLAPYDYEWRTVPIVRARALVNRQGGTYDVLITDDMGCTSTFPIDIKSPDLLKLAPFEDRKICRDDSLKIGAVVSGGIAPYIYSWKCDKSHCSIIEKKSRFLTVNPKYKTNYTLQVSDANECISNTQQIEIHPLPRKQVDAGPDLYAVKGVPIQLEARADTLGAFEWRPLEFLDDPFKTDPVATVYNTTHFTVTYSSDKFCSNKDDMTVHVVHEFKYASAFTPNNDGVNDTWEIRGIDYFPECKVSIYNRWGSTVYTSEGYHIPWNGNNNGKKLPGGTYYFELDLKNGSAPFSGTVTILE